MIKEDGTILSEGKDGGDIYADPYNFNIAKNDKFFSVDDGDFTIEGSSVGPCLVKQDKANSIYDLIDAISGRVIIDGGQGYSSYTYAYDAENETGYVYAKKSSSTDVYQLTVND